MIKCPMCRDLLADTARQCKKCQTDLTLLADYVSHLRDGIARAESLTKQGELGEAVWMYLSVLEIDPDNATARRQVSKVATAVRQFDQTAPGRRWMRSLQTERSSLWSWILLGLLYFGSVMLAYYLGYSAHHPPTESKDEATFSRSFFAGKKIS